MIAAAQEPSGGVYVDDSLACYLHDVSRTPRLTPEQEIELGRRIAEGDTTALRQLVEANLRLVVSIAKHYQNEQLALLDLVQEGNLGLITAARKFDYRLGFRFSTYAVWWIRQSISRAIANHSQAIRLPVHVTAKVARLRRQVSEVGLEQGDGVAEKEADPPTEEMLALVHRAQRPLSLERILSQPDDVSLIDAVEDKQAIVPLESAEENALHDQLNTMLEILPDHQRRVIELRFGLSDGRPRTLREVGSEIGLTRERIRQLEMEALGRLRRCGMAAELYGYLH